MQLVPKHHTENSALPPPCDPLIALAHLCPDLVPPVVELLAETIGVPLRIPDSLAAFGSAASLDAGRHEQFVCSAPDAQ